jgi:DNA-binding protein Fis
MGWKSPSKGKSQNVKSDIIIFEQAGRNQRRAAKLLDISRATPARHLRNVAQK